MAAVLARWAHDKPSLARAKGRLAGGSASLAREHT